MNLESAIRTSSIDAGDDCHKYEGTQVLLPFTVKFYKQNLTNKSSRHTLTNYSLSYSYVKKIFTLAITEKKAPG